ncbi:MAG: hypothetical protein K1X89_30800 [Myxococcaceae bacterium]|nr:hypothetical protein [Myxococcaceae bacterium]
MHGVITSKDVLKNLPLIWREFGTGCVVRCLSAVVRREKTTFLDVAVKPSYWPLPQPPTKRSRLRS